MTDAAELVLEGVPLITDHYDKVYDPLKDKTKQGIRKVKEMRESQKGGGYESEDESYDEYDNRPPRRANTEGRRRSPRDDMRRRSMNGSVVEERYAYRGPASRAQSARRGIPRDGYRGSRRDYSDSESSRSPPPSSRRRRKSLGEKAMVALGLGGVAAAGNEREKDRRSRRTRDRSLSSDYDRRTARRSRSRGAPRSQYDDDRTPARYRPGYADGGGRSDYNGSQGNQVARRDNRGSVAGRERKRSSSSSASSSSDVCSSSEDERRTRKMKGKEYLTAGLAAVATIHAAHNVYSSMEARDKRHEMVAQGEMTPEEARKLKNKARLQDAAAIGIAALGIKGAYSEWKEVQEHRHELLEQQKGRMERHEKRLKKAAKHGGRTRNQSEPDMGRRYRDDR